MEQRQREETGALHPTAAAADETNGSLDSMDGLATTQEQISDMYKAGTIEERGSTR
ncbi:DUF4025 domain-containing protein [Brevibacillus sp. GCM10020057]|uniref:DUF4025 domain-containing protein n=1 Tax=Brevibacillus sp. GCM10020057 TaxID=3317327 RepID=UPI00362DA330